MKSMVAATAFVATGVAGVAGAATTTVAAGSGIYHGLTFTGSGTLSFSDDLMAALDTAKIAVTAYGAAAVNATKDTNGYYSVVAASPPITALTIDTATNAVVDAATTGGATQTGTSIKNVLSGGSLTVTDLDLDLTNKIVYATIIGANGVGTVAHTALWRVGSITDATTVGGIGIYTTTLRGLSITDTGFNYFVLSLGLQTLGKGALQGVTDFGTITSTIVARPVPEPSTYGLMGLGLAAISLVARRRSK